jgi:predicted CXXCH cytochrome family protein
VRATLVLLLFAEGAILGNPAPTRGAPPEAPRCDAPACHGALVSKAHAHTPAAEGECASCHVPTGAAHPGDGAKGFRLVKTGGALCLECHELPARKNVHAPVAEGECTTCHDPHGSGQPALLKQPLGTMCFECHDAAEFKVHVVTGIDLGTGHPLSGVPDPARPGQTLSCVSCHDPHGSDSPKLWRYQAQTSFDLCGRCHRM